MLANEAQISITTCPGHDPLVFSIEAISPRLSKATITIPSSLVDAFYHQALLSHQHMVQAFGFNKGEIPLEYLQENYHTDIIDHLKELLFKYFVLSGLYRNIRDRKILIVGNPRITDIHVVPHEDAHYTFELSVFPEIVLQKWKFFPFKAPKRKNYKDIDRQVESFLKEEQDRLKEFEHNGIEMGDWVSFDVTLTDKTRNPLFADPVHESLWLRMGDEEADAALHELFLGKSVGDSFATLNSGLQEYFNDQIDTHYTFHVTITDVLKHAYFCLEHFKYHFKLKTNKEAFHKLIEVFSYRNDLSQRRAMAEEALKLLLGKHPFDVPDYLVTRQEELILHTVQDNPDYAVYRMQKDFKDHIRQLAKKQCKQMILLEHIAYQENISLVNQDIKAYLNLTNRPRTKEFIYFDLPITKIRGQEVPLPAEELKQICLREKSLNHIIYHLTKK